VTLTGEQLLLLFEQMAARGGEGISKGAELVIANRDGRWKLLSARLNGEEIDAKRTYRVTTIDYLLEGNDGMPAFTLGSDKVAPKETSNNSRFIIMNYFRDKMARGETVDAKVEGRIRVKSEQ
jgi:2',3'-cyclic-nucleotide 2'-phosphodiesterase (5'-nucleotidase family)